MKKSELYLGLENNSFLEGASAPYLEYLYEAYLHDKEAVPQSWKQYFSELLKELDKKHNKGNAVLESEILPSSLENEFKSLARTLNRSNLNKVNMTNDGQEVSNDWPHVLNKRRDVSTRDSKRPALQEDEKKQQAVFELIEAYRLLGHLQAEIDPLSLKQKPFVPELNLSYYPLQESDLETLFDSGTLPGSPEQSFAKTYLAQDSSTQDSSTQDSSAHYSSTQYSSSKHPQREPSLLQESQAKQSETNRTPTKRSLKQLIQDLNTIYCGSIASEFMHIPDSYERTWVQEQVETIGLSAPPDNTLRYQFLKRLSEAEGLEKYLAAKYPGAKRFSLEGLDSFIILLDTLIQQGSQVEIKEMVIGMAHRGRLNVLINIFGKQASQLFDEFEGKHYDVKLESGDVKYHQGFSSDINIQGQNIHLSLAFNPSHLEIVIPVVCGSVRARQDRDQDIQREHVLALCVHGDAAFAGQGVVMETLNMSQTRGFGIGGSIHIIMNNQIGFTTSRPDDARSTLYCSDIGKMLEVPIFHVNANDPEAVYKVAGLAIAYHAKFKKDVIIDLMGYRRWGHNEADEPAATQPLIYKVVRKLPTVFQLYTEKLITEGIIDKEEALKLSTLYRNKLDNEQATRKENGEQTTRTENGEQTTRKEKSEQVTRAGNGEQNRFSSIVAREWQSFWGHDWRLPTKTGVPLATMTELAQQFINIPEGFILHPRLKKLLEERQKMTEGTLPLDWGYAEMMAYATLLNEGYSIRLTGQDCRRGTFFHRHAVYHDQETGREFSPLSTLFNSDTNSQNSGKESLEGKKSFANKGSLFNSDSNSDNNSYANKGSFNIYDSILSEEGVLAFEYGYSSISPKNLVIWEAQYGDFVNGAQIVIDQFISSGEQKWGRLSGLTLFLPHGYEGSGPEHSSARLERFLQLCAGNNMQVASPTTPAQMFHLIRRQMLRPLRKPLVVMTPKSLLRHKLAVSSLSALQTGAFLPVIGENNLLGDEDTSFLGASEALIGNSNLLNGGNNALIGKNDEKNDPLSIQNVNRIILCTGKVYYDLLERRRSLKNEQVALIRIEQLYPVPIEELKTCLDRFPNVQDIVWCQEEPQNQGAWIFNQVHLAGCLRENQRLRYVGRKAAASPAVGYHHLHQAQQEALLQEAFAQK